MKEAWTSAKYHLLNAIGDLGMWLAQRCYARAEHILLPPDARPEGHPEAGAESLRHERRPGIRLGYLLAVQRN